MKVKFRQRFWNIIFMPSPADKDISGADTAVSAFSVDALPLTVSFKGFLFTFNFKGFLSILLQTSFDSN